MIDEATELAKWQRFREDHHLLLDFTKNGVAGSTVLSFKNCLSSSNEASREDGSSILEGPFDVRWPVPELGFDGRPDAPDADANPEITITKAMLWRASTDEFCSLGPFHIEGALAKVSFGELGRDGGPYDSVDLPLLPRRCEANEFTVAGNTNTICLRVKSDLEATRQDALFCMRLVLTLNAEYDAVFDDEEHLDATGQRYGTCARPYLKMTVEAEELDDAKVNNTPRNPSGAVVLMQGDSAFGLPALVALLPWF